MTKKCIQLCFVAILCLTPLLYQPAKVVASSENSEVMDILGEVSPENLGITEPKTLPGSAWYAFTEIKRKIAIIFTFNVKARAVKYLQYSNERLYEAQKLVKNADIREDEAVSLLDKYLHDMKRAKEELQKIQDSDAKEEVRKEMAEQEFLRQRIFDVIEEGVQSEKIQEKREMSLRFFEEVLFSNEGVDDSPKVLREYIEEKIHLDKNGLRDIGVIEEARKIAGDERGEKLKEAADYAITKMVESLKNLSDDDSIAFYEKFFGSAPNIGSDTGIIEQIAAEEDSIRRKIQERIILRQQNSE